MAPSNAQEIPEGTVTVLFTDLVDSTRLNQALGDDAAREVGRAVETMARSAVSANRGVLIKEMGDGLMAAFSSARRAVAAAKEIQAGISRLHRDGLDEAVVMRIGLHTGEVIGEDGDIHGETVIIAKRIEGLAPPGGILASQTVHGVLGTARDELVEQGPAELKGIDHEWNLFLVPVPVDDDAAAALADNAPTPYIGRATERERLRTLVEAAAAGRGGIALLGGPAGLGKSRLVRETAAVAASMGLAVYTGHCVDMESPAPYLPSIDHLEQAARETSPEQFRAALGINAPEVAKLLPSLRQRYDDIPPAPDLPPEQERRYMLHGVGEFIERSARARPMLLVFEDLHWADESTMLLLRHLSKMLSTVPLLVLGTYRDDELDQSRALSSAIGPLIRDAGAIDIHLRPLSRGEVMAILSSRAGKEPPDDLVELIVVETQGNPFFVEELYRHLRDDGRLFDADGNWRSGFQVGETEVPQSVRILIERRLDTLGADSRKMLGSAALIGRVFDFDHLASLFGGDKDELFDALEAAQRAHLVEEHASDRETRYAFVHEQIRQTLLGEFSLARRQQLHLRLADVLEASGRASAVDLAHHLVSAGPASPSARTVRALMDAARTNVDALAFEDALPHIEKAASIAAPGDGLMIARTRASALRGAGRVDEALEVLAAELRTNPDESAQIELRLQKVQLLNEQYRAAEGLDDLAFLRSAWAGAGHPGLEVAVELATGRAHYILSLDSPGHAERSRDAYQAAYEAAKSAGDKVSMARALIPTTWFSDYWDDYGPIAERNVEEAMQLAREVGNGDLLLDAEAASMHGRAHAVRLADAEALLERLEERRDPVKLNAHCFWMMWQYYRLGRFERTVQMCDRGIELADLIGSAPVQYGSIKALALIELGRFDAVSAAIDQEVTDDDHPFGQAVASLAESALLYRLAAWEPARRSSLDTLQRSIDLSRVWMRRWAESMLAVIDANLEVIAGTRGHNTTGGTIRPSALFAAEVALLDGRLEDAVAEAERVVSRSLSEPAADTVRALDIAARAHLDAGDVDRAAAAASQGLRLAEEMHFEALAWRLEMVAALAVGGSTERAAGRFRSLAEKIHEPELRAWFERQKYAPV